MQLQSTVRDLSRGGLSGLEKTEQMIVQKHQGQVTHLKRTGHDIKMKTSGKKCVSPWLWENQELSWAMITVTRSNSSWLPSSSLGDVTMGIISLIQLDTNVVKTYALPQMWGKQAASEKLGIVSTSSNEVQSWLAMPKLWWCQAIWCDQWFKLAQTSSAARRGSLYALSPCWSLTQHKRFRKLCSELGHVIDVAEGYEKKIAKGKNCLTWH